MSNENEYDDSPFDLASYHSGILPADMKKRIGQGFAFFRQFRSYINGKIKEFFKFWDALLKSSQGTKPAEDIKTQPDIQLEENLEPVGASYGNLSQNLNRTMSPHSSSEAAFSAVTGESDRHIRDAAVYAAMGGSLANIRNQTGSLSFISAVEKADNDNGVINRHRGAQMERSIEELRQKGLLAEVTPEMLTNNNYAEAKLEHDEAA